MKTIIKLLLINSFFITIYAQDTHYWSQQYGTKSALLCGAVIGGVRDNSGIYYNPGSIGFIDNKDLSISANAYQWDMIDMKDGAGDGIDLKSSTLQTMPLIISGIFKAKKFPKHSFGYCLLTKDQFNIKTSGRVDDYRNLLNDSYSPGLEDYVSQFSLRASVYEFLSGWAYSYRINDKISVGLGNYGSYRSYHTDWYRVTSVIPTDTSVKIISTFNRTYSMELKNVFTVFKLGVAVNLKQWKFGLTATSPGINVWGLAHILSDVTAANVDYNNDGKLVSFSANDYQEGLNTTYKTPTIIGVGAEYDNGKTLVAFSAEWFDKVDEYTILKPNDNPYVRPANVNLVSSDKALEIKGGKKSVINYAIGFEQKLNSKYAISAGMRTDYSFSIKNKLGPVNLTFTNWDIYHFTVGATKRREKSDLSLCINYAYGAKSDVYQYVNLTNANSTNFFIGEPRKTSAIYNSLSLVIGYTHYIK